MGDTAECADTLDSRELLAQTRAGDQDAFCRLAAQHEQRLLQQAFGLTHNIHTAEDLVCETMVEAWRSLSRYNGKCRFSTWLFSILLHRYQKHLRRACSRPVALASLPGKEADERQRAQENLSATTPSPSEQLLRRESLELLLKALASLPEKHQQVLLLRFFEDASLTEIAALLDCSVGTVKSRLHYALDKLRSCSTDLNLSDLRGDT